MSFASSKLFQAASKAASSLLRSSTSSSSALLLVAEGRTAALATLTNLGRKTPPTAYSFHNTAGSRHANAWGWLPTIAALPAAVYMLQDQEAHAAEMERTFIAIKPDGVQRGLVSTTTNSNNNPTLSLPLLLRCTSGS
uniref:Pco069028 n=1 Tax=Arundo donax TaxID=35708 RepID=A0A0A9E265_ARUDO